MKDKILELVTQNPFITQKEIALLLGCSYETIRNYFRVIGIKSGWIVVNESVNKSVVVNENVNESVNKSVVVNENVNESVNKSVVVNESVNESVNDPDEHINRINAFKKKPEPTPEYISLNDIKNIYDVPRQTMMGIITNDNITQHMIDNKPHISIVDFYKHFDLFIKKHIRMTDGEKQILDERSKKVNDEVRQYDDFNCPID